jgi:hypothetical protein
VPNFIVVNKSSLSAVQPICLTVRLQIMTATMHREPLTNQKRFSHHQGKDQIRQNGEAQSWTELGSARLGLCR